MMEKWAGWLLGKGVNDDDDDDDGGSGLRSCDKQHSAGFPGISGLDEAALT